MRRQHRHQLEQGGEADAGAPDMGVIPHAEGGHVRNIPALGETAGGACVRLDDVHGAAGQHFVEVEAGVSHSPPAMRIVSAAFTAR